MTRTIGLRGAEGIVTESVGPARRQRGLSASFLALLREKMRELVRKHHPCLRTELYITVLYLM